VQVRYGETTSKQKRICTTDGEIKECRVCIRQGRGGTLMYTKLSSSIHLQRASSVWRDDVEAEAYLDGEVREWRVCVRCGVRGTLVYHNSSSVHI